MVRLDKIREDMKARFEIDQDIRDVEVNAETIEEALEDASVQLEASPANLEYEVIERGSAGFMGIGKKAWKLRIYPNAEAVAKTKKVIAKEATAEAAVAEEEKIIDADGLFYIRHFDSSIMLKVIPPVGNGRPVDSDEVYSHLKRPDTENIDNKAVDKFIAKGTGGEYEEVGSYKHIASGDAVISIDVAKDEMSAMMTVDAPAMSGADASFDQILKAIKAQDVVAGVLEDKIKEFVDSPVYGTPYQVAAAILPEDGHDSYIEYNFETDMSKIKVRETETGNVNFKELNRIQNVVKGQTLAKLIPATRGKGGKTLAGRYLEAKNGKDNPVQLGQNVEFDKDGVTIVASVDGQVILVNGKITVEPVMYLDAVNIKSGNIIFLGAVVIKGGVDDGFSVKASGDIEIGGTVGKCKIESDGNIIVRQGIFGKNEGLIKAGKSLWAKFVQETHLEVEENVIATDSLMNCDVTAMKNIVLYGKKAQITGGHLFATEEICARTVGSPGGGATTELTVGVDPRAKKRLDQLQEEQALLSKELENIELDIGTLENQKQIRRSLPSDKEENLTKLMERRDQINEQAEEMNKEIDSLQHRLRDLKAVGKVKVEGTVYPGTKIFVRDVLDEVKTEVTACTFFYENAFAKRGKYEPPLLDISKGPGDGYTTN
ncbi:MAG: FapA family protein [Treponema sp.]